jgi:YHS domain-containing protein
MVRALLELILVIVVARSFWRVVGGILEGLGVQPPGAAQPGAPDRSVSMVRDPVCGTFVVPDRAVTLHEGGQRVAFCSTTCRDKYRAGARARGDRERPAQGRTA